MRAGLAVARNWIEAAIRLSFRTCTTYSMVGSATNLSKDPRLSCHGIVGRIFARENLTGFEVGEVDVEESQQFHDIHPDTRLPPFVWLKVTGRPGVDDFGLSPSHSPRRL